MTHLGLMFVAGLGFRCGVTVGRMVFLAQIVQFIQKGITSFLRIGQLGRSRWDGKWMERLERSSDGGGGLGWSKWMEWLERSNRL